MPVVILELMYWAVSLVLIGSGSMKISQPDEFARFVSRSRSANARSEASEAGPAGFGTSTARFVGLVEVAVGSAALVSGGKPIGWLMGPMYLGFAVVMIVAIRTGAQNCGCFGSMSTKPSVNHLLVNLGSSVVALSGAILGARGVTDTLESRGIRGIAMILGAVLVSGVLIFVLSGANPAILTGQSSKGRSAGDPSQRERTNTRGISNDRNHRRAGKRRDPARGSVNHSDTHGGQGLAGQ